MTKKSKELDNEYTHVCHNTQILTYALNSVENLLQTTFIIVC